MHEPFLNSGWDVFLVVVPFIALLMAGLFRLDALLSASKRSGPPRLPAMGVDENGRTFLRDPDGRPWYFSRKSR